MCTYPGVNRLEYAISATSKADMCCRFAPITIISGIYGMNVSEISGSNSKPNIWQFFVAVVALNFVVLGTLAVSNWIHIIAKHGRKAGAKEVLGFAVGRVEGGKVIN